MKRNAFTLIELLVVVATILLLMSLTAVAVSSARSSQRRNQTRVTISKINEVLSSQWRTYPSQSGSPAFIRRNRITADLPPNWKDVHYMATTNSSFPSTRAQRTYVSVWRNERNDAIANGLPDGRSVVDEDDYLAKCSETFGDDECLFLAVMYGGFAGCLDCAGLRVNKDFKDTDGDGWNEFVDAWGNPLSFILWPVGLQKPDGNSFFNATSSSDTLTFGMRPFVFSAGPDGKYGIEMGGTTSSPGIENLSLDGNCGNPNYSLYTTLGSPSSASDAADNLTNFDAEFRR